MCVPARPSIDRPACRPRKALAGAGPTMLPVLDATTTRPPCGACPLRDRCKTLRARVERASA